MSAFLKVSKVQYRPTIPEDIAALTDQPLPYRIQAITVVIDGVVMGFGGIGWKPDGMVVAFVHARPEASRFRVAFHRAGLMAIAMMRRTGLKRVFAEADVHNPAAERWLLRLGFRRISIGEAQAFIWEA